MDDNVSSSLDRLLTIARTDSGQARRVANFLLAWWNAEEHGGFDLTDLANVDRTIAEDMATIFTSLAQSPAVYYPDNRRAEIEQIIARWRPKFETA